MIRVAMSQQDDLGQQISSLQMRNNASRLETGIDENTRGSGTVMQQPGILHKRRRDNHLDLEPSRGRLDSFIQEVMGWVTTVRHKAAFRIGVISLECAVPRNGR